MVGLQERLFCVLQIFFKNAVSKCKLRLLEPLKQPHLKTKMFFERELINPNNEKYLVKTIGYMLQYTIYGSTTTAIASVISVTNIGARVKFHFQLPSSLFLRSCQKKITYAMYCEHVDKEQKIKPLFHCTHRRIRFVKALTPMQFL